MAVSTNFYVYALFRPWDGSPCYIGKGKGKRYLQHAGQGKNHPNKRLAKIIAKAGGEIPAIIIHANLNEHTALAYEIALIAAIGRGRNGPLTNMTDGGEGVVGLKHSEKTRRLMSESHIGKVFTPEHCANLKKAWIGREPHPNSLKPHPKKFQKGQPAWNKGIPRTEEQKAHHSRVLTGRSGTPWTEERKQAMSLALKGIAPVAAIAAKGGRKLKGRRLPAEHIRKISEARKNKPHPHKGVPRSAATRAKISATKRQKFAAMQLAA